MTKIAIISQPEQGVLVDVGGCITLQEASQHLTSTLQVSSQFWEDQPVDLSLGNLTLTKEEVQLIFSIFAEVGVKPRHVYSQCKTTKTALQAQNVEPATGAPASLPLDEATAGGAPDKCELGTVTVLPEAVSITADSVVEGEVDKEEGTESDTTAEAPAVPAAPPAPAVPHVLYLKQTLRSGQAVSHKGHLVIVGDVNPGAEVMAEGDIIIWGALRGVAHAGVGGNANAEIRALRFDPIQLRIAHAIARAPDRPRGALKSSGPETARIVSGTIRISSSTPE